MSKAQSKYNIRGHIESSAIGDYAQVNNYFPADRAAADPGLAELRRLFEEVNRRLEALPAADRELVRPAVEQAAQAAAEIQSGDESEEKQSFLETRLRHIAAMAPDIGEVIVATLVSPAAGLAITLQKIARRVQAELGGEKAGG